MPAARATKAAIKRAIDAWREAGLEVGGMEVTPDGLIRITRPVDRPEETPQSSGPKKWRKA